MMTASALYDSLSKIVSKDFVSDRKEERYFYARDGGLMPPHEPDFVVMPKTTEEVQEIVKLANREKIPVVCETFAPAVIPVDMDILNFLDYFLIKRVYKFD